MMRIVRHGGGFLAVQPFQGPKGPAHAAGWGITRLEAMAACTGLLAAMEKAP